MRFRMTIYESIDKDGKISPGISDKGYLDELEGFHEGFLMLASICNKKKMDLFVSVSYYKKSERTYIADKPV